MQIASNRVARSLPSTNAPTDYERETLTMDDWEEFTVDDEVDDPEIDLDQMVDMLIEHYGLRAEETESRPSSRVRVH
jgi:hypothetical protein